VQRLELAAFRQGVAKKTRSVIGTNSKWNIDRKSVTSLFEQLISTTRYHLGADSSRNYRLA
jgi:hypothetical protein